MKDINFGLYAILSGLRMPASGGNRAIVVAKGKLSVLIKRGLELSDADYYGLTIACTAGLLWKKGMKDISTWPDFPK